MQISVPSRCLPSWCFTETYLTRAERALLMIDRTLARREAATSTAGLDRYLPYPPGAVWCHATYPLVTSVSRAFTENFGLQLRREYLRDLKFRSVKETVLSRFLHDLGVSFHNCEPTYITPYIDTNLTYRGIYVDRGALSTPRVDKENRGWTVPK